MVKRVLRENTRAFRADNREVRPITGFSCWALGYLDPACRLVGCLLHPARHGGEDLRFRVDFGEKCRREACPEAAVFDRLTAQDQAFWLHLADGLDAFAYSSRSRNPLFHLLNWGTEILQAIAAEADAPAPGLTTLLDAFPFLGTRLSPRGWSYPVKRLAAIRGPGLFRQSAMTTQLEAGLLGLLERSDPVDVSAQPADTLPTHRLPMDRSFLDFLRLSFGIQRISLQEAQTLKSRVDVEIERLL
jgi:hypothetical protein